MSQICLEKIFDIVSEYHNSPSVVWLCSYRRRRQTMKSTISATSKTP